MPTEIGTAYISISGRTDGLRADIEKALNGVEKSGTTHGKNYGNAFGSGASTAMAGAGGASAARFTDSFQREANTRATRIGSAVGTLLGGAVVGAAGVAVAGLGAVLFKGLDRYRSIDKTAKRLGAMGKTSDQIKTVMDGINDAIKGTPIALDEAADSATKFLSGGVKEGKPLNDIMLAIADAAGASGQSFGDLATIFGQVMNKGKLQAEEMNQLNERGINIQAALRDEFGLTKDQLTQLSADGKITFDQLLQAVEGSFGGMAKAAGNSIDGAISNVKTSVARLGANFLSAIFGDPLSTTEGPGAMAEAINKIGVKIDGLNQWVTAHQGEIKQFFADAAQVVGDLAAALGKVAGFLIDHPRLVETAAAAYVAFKGAQVLGSIATLSTKLLELGGVIGKGSGPGATGLIGGVYGLAAVLGIELGRTIFDKMKEDANEAEAAINRVNDALHQQFPGTPLNPTDVATGSTGSTGPTNPLNPNNIYGPSAPTVGAGAAGPPVPGLPTGGRAGPGAPATSLGPLVGRGAAATAGSYGLPANTNSGGYGGSGAQFPGWVNQVAQAFNLKPSTYPGHQASNRNEAGYAPNPGGLNRGIDWSGSPQNMQRFADYLKNVPGMEQVIWNGAGVGTGDTVEIAGGKPQPGYFAGDLAGHGNHVHTRQSAPIPLIPGLFDTGGWLGPGQTMAQNNTGKPELILNPEQIKWLQDQGIDPQAILSGKAQPPPGMPQGPLPTGEAPATGRTEGYIPAGAGYTGKTGGGVAGGFFNLAAEGINGAIDMAAQAASMGAGIAAPGAGAGIGIGADMAKRGVSYAAEMAGIGVGALSEILLPFGAPRWLSDVDPTSFMPHTGVQAAGTTTAEQAVLDQQAQGSQVDPNTMQHGQGMGAPPGPTDPAAFIPPAPPVDAAAMTPAEVRGGDTINLYPKDVDESFRLLAQRQKLNAMQYGGRP